jgi:N-acetyl-gamma-glutamyl-phosphate reductase
MPMATGVTRERVSVGVAGATGYAGQELVRLLARHPHVRLVAAMASSAGSPQRPLPALARVWDDDVVPLDLARLSSETEAVFLALPEDASADVVPALLERGRRVFDLSGAYRLRDNEQRTHWYPKASTLPDGSVYGLTETARPALPSARLVACPGCYPTPALLALQPLRAAGLVRGDTVIDAKSGISGAGKTPTERTHFSECHGSVSAYGVFAHRHGAEIEQELGCRVTFVPHLVPLDRGILETIYVGLAPHADATAIAAAYERAYGAAPFVRLTGDALPTIRHVAGTNFCDIGWKVEQAGGRLVLVACIDNLLKGAAGQAVQNFNVAFGFDERAGLWA